jgi:hypothetical protein
MGASSRNGESQVAEGSTFWVSLRFRNSSGGLGARDCIIKQPRAPTQQDTTLFHRQFRDGQLASLVGRVQESHCAIVDATCGIIYADKHRVATE